MVQIDTFFIEQWIEGHVKGTKYNLAASTCPALSLQDLESVKPEGLAQHDVLSSISSTPMGYADPPNGLTELCSQITKIYLDESSSPIPLKNVLTTPGASLANFLVFYALIGPGDHVIVHYPTYQQLHSVPASLGAEVSNWQTSPSHNWQLDMDELRRLIRPNTKMIVINNPQNPTGAVASKSTLEAIVRIAAEHEIIVFGDEIYRPLFHSIDGSDPELPPSILSLGYKNTIVTSALSKAYSLAGLRLGWIVSENSEIIKLCSHARAYLLMRTSQLDEHVAAFALQVERRRKIVEINTVLAKRNVAIVQSFIDQHAATCSWVTPIAAPIGFVQFKRPESGKPVDDIALCTCLHETRGLLLIPGKQCFGSGKDFPGYVRLGFGIDTKALEAALDVLDEFLTSEEYASLPLADEAK